uniref:Putative secreted protein n=1 Tax=Panstrongylus lignarius TaxID=156445 RepID=A0A224Y6M9_9HEMI
MTASWCAVTWSIFSKVSSSVIGSSDFIARLPLRERMLLEVSLSNCSRSLSSILKLRFNSLSNACSLS